jgi:hypothetical protein
MKNHGRATAMTSPTAVRPKKKEGFFAKMFCGDGGSSSAQNDGTRAMATAKATSRP